MVSVSHDLKLPIISPLRQIDVYWTNVYCIRTVCDLVKIMHPFIALNLFLKIAFIILLAQGVSSTTSTTNTKTTLTAGSQTTSPPEPPSQKPVDVSEKPNSGTAKKGIIVFSILPFLTCIGKVYMKTI